MQQQAGTTPVQGMSLKFLLQKSWHPGSLANIKRKWTEEQKAKDREAKEKEAAKELVKAQEHMELTGSGAAGGLAFLYAPPPGYKAGAETVMQNSAEDDAVREFKALVERRQRKAQGLPESSPSTGGAAPTVEGPQPLPGHEEGERDDVEGDTREEKFPMLKNAPVEGAYTENVAVKFHPLGLDLRPVKCMRCGKWGHKSGDRECEMKDPSAADAMRIRMEDPLATAASHPDYVDESVVAAIPPAEKPSHKSSKKHKHKHKHKQKSHDRKKHKHSSSSKSSKHHRHDSRSRSRSPTRRRHRSSSSSSSGSSSSSSEGDRRRHQR